MNDKKNVCKVEDYVDSKNNGLIASCSHPILHHSKSIQ